jgi:DNA-binding NtrC family response regulator
VSSSTIPYVFVVDDELVIASTVAAILRRHGYSARSFTSPLEALDAVRTRAPDLLISDVAMPLISGVDLAIQMRKQCPTCKILLFSGQTTTCDCLESTRARGHTFDLLLEPVPPTELLFEVEKMVNGFVTMHAVSLVEGTFALK